MLDEASRPPYLPTLRALGTVAVGGIEAADFAGVSNALGFFYHPTCHARRQVPAKD